MVLLYLAQKIRRGIEGRIRQGRSGGGLAYGYRMIRQFNERGGFDRGGRVVELIAEPLLSKGREVLQIELIQWNSVDQAV